MQKDLKISQEFQTRLMFMQLRGLLSHFPGLQTVRPSFNLLNHSPLSFIASFFEQVLWRFGIGRVLQMLRIRIK